MTWWNRKSTKKLVENMMSKEPETTKGLGRMMFDPLNLVEGPVGHALMGIELMSNKKEKLP